MVAPGGHEPFAVGEEGHARDHEPMALEIHARAVGALEVDEPAVDGGGRLTVVGRRSQRRSRGPVDPGRSSEQWSRSRFPEVEPCRPRRRDHREPVRREACVEDRAVVACQRRQSPATERPGTGSAVRARRHDRLPVGAEVDRAHEVVCPNRAPQRARDRVPDPAGAVGARRRDLCSTRADSDVENLAHGPELVEQPSRVAAPDPRQPISAPRTTRLPSALKSRLVISPGCLSETGLGRGHGDDVRLPAGHERGLAPVRAGDDSNGCLADGALEAPTAAGRMSLRTRDVPDSVSDSTTKPRCRGVDDWVDPRSSARTRRGTASCRCPRRPGPAWRPRKRRRPAHLTRGHLAARRIVDDLERRLLSEANGSRRPSADTSTMRNRAAVPGTGCEPAR